MPSSPKLWSSKDLLRSRKRRRRHHILELEASSRFSRVCPTHILEALLDLPLKINVGEGASHRRGNAAPLAILGLGKYVSLSAIAAFYVLYDSLSGLGLSGVRDMPRKSWSRSTSPRGGARCYPQLPSATAICCIWRLRSLHTYCRACPSPKQISKACWTSARSAHASAPERSY